MPNCAHCTVRSCNNGTTEKAPANCPGRFTDKEKELARLEAEKKKLEGEIKRVEGKLNNAGFMAKAPEKLVAEEREKGEKYKAMLDKVLESIKAINEM